MEPRIRVRTSRRVSGAQKVVGDLAEDSLIERILGRLRQPPEGEVWAGDDAAVLRPPPGDLLFTTDVLVEGVDFSWGWCSGHDVGWKAMAVNASDIAAMGGRPGHALATLALSAATPVALVDDIVGGLVESAAAVGIDLVGGDISSARELSLGVALLGAAGPHGAVTRSGARVGDALCVTGHLGGAAGGLTVLREGLWTDALLSGPAEPGPRLSGGPAEPGPRPGLRRLAARQLRPRARTHEGQALAALGATSMIDVSDGLLLDLLRLMTAAGHGCWVDPGLIPVDPDLSEIAGVLVSEEDLVSLAARGGEDFELLFTMDARRVARARAELAENVQVTQIGVVTEAGCRFGDEDIESMEQLGWEHLRNR
jgi:thiamine-monophosphate kinase